MKRQSAPSRPKHTASSPTRTLAENASSTVSKSQKLEQPRTTRTRIANPKTGQIHHARSDYERDYLSVLMLSPNVIKIREHYPLNLVETLEIAAQLGIKHPLDSNNKTPKQIRTHFLITVRGGNEDYDVARTLAKSDTMRTQNIARMEIERVYWSHRAIDWGVITEREFPQVLRDNARLLYPHISIGGIGRTPENLATIVLTLTEITAKDNLPLSEVAQFCDRKFRLTEGTSIRIVYHLIASHQWRVDLLMPIRPDQHLLLEGHTPTDEIDISTLQ